MVDSLSFSTGGGSRFFLNRKNFFSRIISVRCDDER